MRQRGNHKPARPSGPVSEKLTERFDGLIPDTSIKCAECGMATEIYNLGQRFCSSKCRHTWHNKRTAEAKRLFRETHNG